MITLAAVLLAGLFGQTCDDPSCRMCYGSYCRNAIPAARQWYDHTPDAEPGSPIGTHYRPSKRHPWPFSEARAKALKEGRPLLIMVSAEWCGSCRRIKDDLLPAAADRGMLDGLGFAVIDYDLQNTLAEQIVCREGLPQWVRYERIDGKLYRWGFVYAPKDLKQLSVVLRQSLAPYVRIRRLAEESRDAGFILKPMKAKE